MKWISDKTVAHLRAVADSPDLSGTKYRLGEEIGRGGMAVVYLARDTELERDVAIKVLNLVDVTPAMVNRMLREAQVIATLEHPAIVPVHDVGSLPDGRVFYAMKLIRGHRLDKHIEDLKTVFDRLRVFLRVCEAVAFAHANNIIHRDLKPENVMVGAFGEVLVLDWGVAKLIDGAKNHLANNSGSDPERAAAVASSLFETNDHGLVVGTPGYMSPEQAKGVGQIDEQSDIYALGGILYFLLTGRPPADVARATGVADARPATAVLPPRRVRREVAKRLEAICLRAMSPSRASRYATVAELAADVSNFLEDKPVTAYHENVLEKASRWASRNRFLLLLVMAYLLMRVILIFASRD